MQKVNSKEVIIFTRINKERWIRLIDNKQREIKNRKQQMTTTLSSLGQSGLNASSKIPKQNFPARIDALGQNLQQIQRRLLHLTQEQESIKEAKINVERYLDQKSEENKQRLIGELKRYEDEVKRKIQNTRMETQKIDDKIVILKNGQLQALQLILGIQRRVQELEVQLGVAPASVD